MELLKFITCGSVDDGKSTLIGHMLYDAKLIFADQKEALLFDSKIKNNENIDYSFLLDGLIDERRQGITIDVSYRFFKTKKRSFIVADCPGHDEYTKNMVVGASFAELAVILIDATKGVLSQTIRHIKICKMMGIKDFIFAINKMDLVKYDKNVYNNIIISIKKILNGEEINNILYIPVSAKIGDNLINISENMPWYKGDNLLSLLENIEVYNGYDNDDNYVLPIQRMSKQDFGDRYYQGEILSGKMQANDEVLVLPSYTNAKIKKIIVAGEKKEKAEKGDPVAISIDKELNIPRGSVLVRKKSLNVSSRFIAKIIVLDNRAINVKDHFRMMIGTDNCEVKIEKILYKIDIDSDKKIECDNLHQNEIGLCEINCNKNVVFEKYDKLKALGDFILIDILNHNTTIFGTIEYPLLLDGDVVKQDLSITRSMRENKSGNKAITLFFTGLPSSGKSTLADNLEKKLFNMGMKTMILDGDNIRMGLCNDLGFSESDRTENIRRISEVSKLLNDAGVIVLSAFVAPFKKDREMAKNIIGDSYIEIYVDAPLDICMKRDVKGHYKKAKNGEIKNFTGVESPYEVPDKSDIIVDTVNGDIDECVNIIYEKIVEKIKL